MSAKIEVSDKEQSTECSKVKVTNFFDTKLSVEKRYLKNSDDFVLLNILAGKPNRKRELEIDPLYVRQPQQKMGSCIYHSFKIAALSDQDYLIKQQTAARKAASQFRKSMTLANYIRQIFIFFFPIINQKTPVVQDENTSNKSKASNTSEVFKRSFITNFRMIIKMLQEEGELFQLVNMKEEKSTKDDYEILAGLLSAFVDKYESSKELDPEIFSTQEYFRERISGCLTFLRALNLDPVKACMEGAKMLNEQLTKELYVVKEEFAGMQLEEKLWILNVTAEFHLARVFDLAPNKHWSPLDEINVLLKALKQNPKPFIIGGGFGKLHYNKKEIEVTSIDHYAVYGFPKDSHKGSLQTSTHCVAMIGVEINRKGNMPSGWVYYVDPLDSSDPNHSDSKKRQRKIFKISYEQFCKWALDNSNRNEGDHPVKPSKNLKYGYWNA